MRASFVSQRLSRPVTGAEAKDLTDFFHAEEAEIEECSNCMLLIRRECERPPAEDYSKDEYDQEAVEREYPEYVAAFERKSVAYSRSCSRAVRRCRGGRPLRCLPAGSYRVGHGKQRR